MICGHRVKIIIDNIGILDIENEKFQYLLFHEECQLNASISDVIFEPCKNFSFLLNFAGYKKKINLKYRNTFRDYYFFGKEYEFFIKIIERR